MRHHVQGRKLGMKSAHRKAFFANMATSLIIHNRIETTLPRAKALRSIADRLVTMGKSQTLHARRRAIALIRDKAAVHKLFDELASRFKDRNGGYTRVLKLGFRHGDAAPMAAIEYLPSEHAAGSAGSEGGYKSEAHAKKPKDAGHKKGAKSTAKIADGKKSAPRRISKATSAKTVAKRSSPTRKVSRSGD